MKADNDRIKLIEKQIKANNDLKKEAGMPKIRMKKIEEGDWYEDFVSNVLKIN